MKNDALSIILPVFNEAEIIEEVVQEICAYTTKKGIDAEIIVVNDGSSDKTPEILDRISTSLPDLKIISHKNNQGYGVALRSGINAAQNKWILIMDADGQVKIDSLQEAWGHRHDHDLLLGYRPKRADNLYRLILGKLGNTLSNWSLEQNLRDINCGFKLFRKDLIQPLDLSSNGNSIYFEIAYRLFKNDPLLKWHQFPVTHYPRKAGRSTGGNYQVIFKIIVEGTRTLSNNMHSV